MFFCFNRAVASKCLSMLPTPYSGAPVLRTDVACNVPAKIFIVAIQTDMILLQPFQQLACPILAYIPQFI